MAATQSKPSPHTNRAPCAALVVIVAVYATPALTAHPKISHCEKNDEITFEVPLLELSAITVHHDISLTILDEIGAATDATSFSSEHLLAPRAEAAIRSAFSTKTSLRPVVEYDRKNEPVGPSGFNTRVPGVADDELSRFRKQMYRRDI